MLDGEGHGFLLKASGEPGAQVLLTHLVLRNAVRALEFEKGVGPGSYG